MSNKGQRLWRKLTGNSSFELFSVRAGKTHEALELLDADANHLDDIGAERAPEFRDEHTRLNTRFLDLRQQALNTENAKLLGKLCKQLEPVKVDARKAAEAAEKLFEKLNSQFSKNINTATKLMDTVRTLREELGVAPSGVDGIHEQMEMLKLLSTQVQNAYEDLKDDLDDPNHETQITVDRVCLLADERVEYLRQMLDRFSTSEKQCFQSKAIVVQAAIKVLDRVLGGLTQGQEPHTRLSTLRGTLVTRRQNMLGKTSTKQIDKLETVMGAKKPAKDAITTVERLLEGNRFGDMPLSSPKIREEDVMETVLDFAFGLAGMDPSHVDHLLHESHVACLNDQPWNTITREVIVKHEGEPVKLTSEIKPVSQLGNIYARMNGKGVCCHDSKHYSGAVNLASTEIKSPNGTVLFSGLRHGINSAFGFKAKELDLLTSDELELMIGRLRPDMTDFGINDPTAITQIRQRYQSDDVEFRKALIERMRKKANENRSLDVVTASLIKNQGKLQQALNGNVVDISINSMSLVTPDRIRGTERVMLQEQMEAWQALSGPPQPRTITILDNNNQPINVQVNIAVNAFNFGVNEGAMTSSARTKIGNVITGGSISGWDKSDEYNRPAMDRLIGTADQRRQSQTRLAGQVGQWLTANGNHPDREKVKTLALQIAGIWDTKSYKNQGTEPYKMVSRLALLTHLMGNEPAFNCKSGKDRTGQLDVEVKHLATQLSLTGDVPEPDHELSETEKSNRLQMALNAGNHDMQQLNTGNMGFKLQGVGALDESYGDEGGVKAFRGTSKYVGA